MIDMYFNENGTWWQDASEVTVADEDLNVYFFLGSAPDVPRWRLTLDIESGIVTDRYDGMTIEEAEAQLDIDVAAEMAAAEAAAAALNDPA